jgi:hypothetical protein
LKGDFYARRNGGTTGVYYFVDGGDKYLYWDGGKYVFGGSHNIAVGGTVDGRDLASDGSKLDGIDLSANNYTHPAAAGDDINIDTGALTGATVISDLDFNITTNTLGHVTDANGTVATRTLTPANIGAVSLGSNDTITSVKKITSAGNLIYEKSSIGGFVPVLAQTVNSGQTQTGAIKLRFPSGSSTDMMCGWVDIYNYTADDTVSIFIGGYLYQGAGANEWVNESVTTLCNNTSQDFTVRFGHDGTEHCIYIGELNTTWSYSQITARDWTIGYSADIDAYATGTTITYESSAFQNVDATKSGNLPVASSAASATTAASCTGNSATATSAASCTGNSATATLASTVTVNSSTSAAWYDALWASGNTVYGQSNVEIYPNGGYLRAVYLNMTHAVATRNSDTVFFSSTDDYIRKNNATGFRTSLNVPTRTGGDASGTWAINITGTAGNSTTSQVTADSTGNRALVLCTADGTTRNETLYKDAGTSLYFNTSNNTLVAPTFSGALSGNATTATTATQASGAIPVQSTGVDDRDKIRVWSTDTYGFGMESAVTFGFLNDYAITTQMSNTANRGFWWGDSGHTKSGGAMSLTTTGQLYVATRIAVGEGEADTSPLATYTLNVTGTIGATSNITAYASDKRLKENIEPIENALSKVQRLRGVTFDWKDSCEDIGFTPDLKTETGVIAQEVQEVIPDAVKTAPFNQRAIKLTGVDENYLTVDKEKIIPLLIEAIKEQQKQIDELKGAK